MKFCQHCGKEILDEAVICSGCGCSVSAKNNLLVTEIDESINVGFVILAAFSPLFGFIYWVVKEKTRPRCARACGIAAIISLVISVVLLMDMF